MAVKGKAETFIESTSGCGPFQIFILIFVVAANISTAAYTILFMSFGNYNPGWRCLDNTTSPNISITTIDPGDVDYTTGSCDEYNQCRRVEFNPETSTIVTEWGLLCDKAWMSSMTISIQMVGMLVFSFIAGQLADTFGRKKTLYGGIALCGILQLASSFSVSWIMFVIFLFFICGLSMANVLIVWLYVSEFMTIKWRAIIMAFPFWYIGTTIQAVTAMITKDWRQLFIVGFSLHVLCFIPVFWVPESLRWLEVKQKSRKFDSVARKFVRCNKSGDSPMLNKNSANGLVNGSKSATDDVKKYTILDIFRHGYILISICLGIITFLFGLAISATAFGTKIFYGDFNINLIVVNAIGIPVFLLALLGINYVSRKRITFILLSIAAVCVFVATGLLFSSSQTAKSIGSTVLIAVSRSAVDATSFCINSRITEIYPTVVRGIALGYASVTARTGDILGPFLIPEEREHMYILTTVFGALILVSGILSFALPETKGKPLKDNFENRIYEIDLEQPLKANECLK